MKLSCVHVVAVTLFVTVLALVPAEASNETRNLIHTEGVAEVMGQNDSAGVSLSVVTEGRDLESVSADNAAKTKQVLQSIEQLSIDRLKKKTANFRVDPQSDYKNRPPRIVGYRVHNTVELTLEGFAPAELSGHVSRILGVALENGANSVQSLRFYIKDKDPLEKMALTEATRQAIDRARALAEAAGVKLKRIAAISSQPGPPMPVRMMDRGVAMAAEAAAPPPVESGESVIRAQVQISYEIE